MRIGILGSRPMGGRLGTLFAQAGRDMTFSYARQQPGAAVPDAHAILLAVHGSRLDDLLSQAGDLSGKTIVTRRGRRTRPTASWSSPMSGAGKPQVSAQGVEPHRTRGK